MINHLSIKDLHLKLMKRTPMYLPNPKKKPRKKPLAEIFDMKSSKKKKKLKYTNII